jgi:hypothetical protein
MRKLFAVGLAAVVLSACAAVGKTPIEAAPAAIPAHVSRPITLPLPSLVAPSAPVAVPAPAYVARELVPAPAPAAVVVAAPRARLDLPWGEWLLELLDLLGPLLVPLAMLLASPLLDRIPGPAGVLVRAYMTRGRFEQAISAGINSVKGAAHGKSLSIEIGKPVAAAALQFIADNWTKTTIRAAGGPDAIRAQIVAMLPLEADATIADVERAS